MTDAEKLFLAKQEIDRMGKIETIKDTETLKNYRKLVLEELSKPNPIISDSFSRVMMDIFISATIWSE
jgi:hypothetical protein